MNTQIVQQNYSKHTTHGFTMIEVLIALVVLSIGLLGLAGLQSTGLRFNQSAGMRTQATQLAYDMSDRMRSNMTATNAGNYLGSSQTSYAVVTNCHNTTGCTPANMATDDLAGWSQAVLRYLPLGTWVICRDATPNDGTGVGANGCDNNAASPFAIKMWWDDDRDGNPDEVPFAVAFVP
jgi:type IV pilus assembly protein PilV